MAEFGKSANLVDKTNPLNVDKNIVFSDFLAEFLSISSNEKGFQEQTREIKDYIKRLSDADMKAILRDIGTIPECIQASSSSEKLFSKASDIVLARAFEMLGLNAEVSFERSDSADVVAKSELHYSLVADAKCFRLSRTAKNQKDFKISNLSKWRGKNYHFAVLVAPYFQYPKKESQIYESALKDEVCILAWEHILILLENNIKESQALSLEHIWARPKMLNRESKIENKKMCLLPDMDDYIAKTYNIKNFKEKLNLYKNNMIERSSNELVYYTNEMAKFKNLSKEETIKRLIKEAKLEEKVKAIKAFISKMGLE